MEEDKNNQKEAPQANADSANAGGQADLSALKAQIANQTGTSDATETTPPVTTPPAEPKAAATAKKYAGKFEDDKSLEEGYKNLESKLGQKSDHERIGKKLQEYSGQELADLEKELDTALLKNQYTELTNDTPAAPDPEVRKLKSDIALLKAQELERKLSSEKEALLQEHPESARYIDTLADLWKNVDTKKSLKEIYTDRFALAEEAVKAQTHDKSKEDFKVESTVTGTPASLDEIDVSKFTADQLKEILPHHGNY